MRQLLLIGSLALAGSAFGLHTAYVEFDHPQGWKCELTEGVWICQSTLDPDRKESLVMSIAALASEWDSIEHFEQYLKQPREITADLQNKITSEISYTRRRNLNGHVWVDSLQHNSELAGFWTRYLATVNQKLAILITYIVSDEYYSKLAPQFERMVVSLTLVNQNEVSTPSLQSEIVLPGPEKLGPSTELIRERLNTRPATSQPLKKPIPATATIVILLLAALYLAWRMKSRIKKPQKIPPTPPNITKP